ncbi:MAG: zinc dependent phospholipase C family protein [Chitinophagales bacterium]|nr:zinc dependent phospholipase C family protein [Chitinophagales bacterium]
MAFNRLAVFTLPPQMISFYKDNIEYITEHAVDPDKRRYSDPEEAPHHYIDLDRYGTYPFDSLPRRWNDAVAKYTEDSLNKHGVVPWWISLELIRLTDAFKEKNKYRILHYSADIGHYIADAHVPLHCTSNYNGQLTNQKGIHAFWESRVPELFGDEYDYFVGKAEYIEHPGESIWKSVMQSAAAVDSVLGMEKILSQQFPSDQKYTYEDRGESNIRTYSKDYSAAYEKMLDDMQEKRMRAAIITIGSFWYTAWVNAGKPDLSDLKDSPASPEDIQQLNAMDKSWRDGKIIGRTEE